MILHLQRAFSLNTTGINKCGKITKERKRERERDKYNFPQFHEDQSNAFADSLDFFRFMVGFITFPRGSA